MLALLLLTVQLVFSMPGTPIDRNIKIVTGCKHTHSCCNNLVAEWRSEKMRQNPQLDPVQSLNAKEGNTPKRIKFDCSDVRRLSVIDADIDNAYQTIGTFILDCDEQETRAFGTELSRAPDGPLAGQYIRYGYCFLDLTEQPEASNKQTTCIDVQAPATGRTTARVDVQANGQNKRARAETISVHRQDGTRSRHHNTAYNARSVTFVLEKNENYRVCAHASSTMSFQLRAVISTQAM